MACFICIYINFDLFVPLIVLDVFFANRCKLGVIDTGTNVQHGPELSGEFEPDWRTCQDIPPTGAGAGGVSLCQAPTCPLLSFHYQKYVPVGCGTLSKGKCTIHCMCVLSRLLTVPHPERWNCSVRIIVAPQHISLNAAARLYNLILSNLLYFLIYLLLLNCLTSQYVTNKYR